MDYGQYIEALIKKLAQLRDGIVTGFSYGFHELNRCAGRIQRGQVITIGGFTGTGKSYFALNMIAEALKDNPDAKIAIFSSELSTLQYLFRYACMQNNLWKIQVEQYPKDHFSTVEKTLLDFASRPAFHVWGDIISIEEIQDKIDEHQYDLIFIDFVQNLSAQGKFDEKEKMPIIAEWLRKTALQHQIGVVAISQMNVSAMSKNPDNLYSHGFSYGKELSHISHTAIKLHRLKDGDTFKDLDYLEARIVKARDGQQGTAVMKITPGYKLIELNQQELNEYKSNYYENRK